MAEHLVRWKYGRNSLLNHLDEDTSWFQQFHPDKEKAVNHYVSLLRTATPSMAMTVEIFRLTKLKADKEDG